MAGPDKKHWNIVLLTCRDPATDFRLPLAEELRLLGHRVHYVYLRRRPIVTDLRGIESKREFSQIEFLQFMRRNFHGVAHVLFLNSTNLVFPMLSRVLRLLCGGLWCFDMHDDLFYSKKGVALVKAKIAQRILIGGSDLMVHAAPTLKEIFPASRHLGNASTITAIERRHPDFRKVLILASIDERMNFEFLTAAARAAPELRFDIYGQISRNDAQIRAQVDEMVGSMQNIRYLGPYVNGELTQILSSYAVTLAPYAASSLTYFIDPLRYYHCLNSGMEVISTDIPKARDFGGDIHIIRDPVEVSSLVRGLADGSTARRNTRSTALVHNWRNRAVRLIEIAAASQAAAVTARGKAF